MQRSGLTLLRIIVVLAAFSILAAMLAPALQSSRQRQRRTDCAAKLHNIALGFHNYHDNYGFLPPGEGGHSNGLFARIQPFMEMQTISSQIIMTDGFATWLDPNLPAGQGKTWWSSDDMWNIVQQETDQFVCPSVDSELKNASRALTSIRFKIDESTGGPTANLNFVEPGVPGLNTYAGVAGVTGRLGLETFEHIGRTDLGDWREGMFTANSRLPFPAIIDGTSNTLAVGEYLGHYDQELEAWTLHGTWAGAQTMWSAFTMARTPEEATWKQFSGPHAGITMFALGDASVRPFRNTIGLGVFRAICGMRDGAIIDMRDLEAPRP